MRVVCLVPFHVDTTTHYQLSVSITSIYKVYKYRCCIVSILINKGFEI